MKHLQLLGTCLLSLALLSLPAAFAAEQEIDPAAMKQQVDINTADAETIALALNGVGTEKAQEIVAHREKHGAFKNVDQLMDVKGIGKATVDRNRDRILITTK